MMKMYIVNFKQMTIKEIDVDFEYELHRDDSGNAVRYKTKYEAKIALRDYLTHCVHKAKINLAKFNQNFDNY